MKHYCVVFYFVPERGKKKREALVIVAEKTFFKVADRFSDSEDAGVCLTGLYVALKRT